jgi:tetratricopeptide (TPR) repeat protein
LGKLKKGEDLINLLLPSFKDSEEGNWQLQLWLSEVKIKGKNFPEAFSILQKIEEKSPYQILRINAQLKSAEIYLSQQKYQKALQTVKKILLQFSHLPEIKGSALTILGSAFSSLHQPQKALKCYHQILEVGAENSNLKSLCARTYKRMADLYLKMKNYQEAKKHYQHALSYYQRSALWYFSTVEELFLIYLKEKRFDEFLKLTEKISRHPIFRFHLKKPLLTDFYHLKFLEERGKRKEVKKISRRLHQYFERIKPELLEEEKEELRKYLASSTLPF